jgi:hypothetical protein
LSSGADVCPLDDGLDELDAHAHSVRAAHAALRTVAVLAIDELQTWRRRQLKPMHSTTGW